MSDLTCDVLVIGAGGAGMYAAIAAARAGARVVLLDKSLIGRGGATVMAQMTVAAAMGHATPDHWTEHLADTLAAGRGLCHEPLAAALCEDAPARILEMEAWRTGWAADGDGADRRFRQVMAPGHGKPRCVYVDFIDTGPSVSKALRTQLVRLGDRVRRIGDMAVVELLVADGACAGAVALDPAGGAPVVVAAGATVIATGGLTRLFRRNSASANMGGDGFALALRAGATLMDMEFVQFFPIGHLAPRMVGMDPIMWDPFRYKLGGLLLNGRGEEFIERYGSTDGGTYTTPRDLTTYAIVKEVEAGRGSPAGGVYLSFAHLPVETLRAAFGPVIDRLAANGIDLTRDRVEVAPIAHYHMGGIRVDTAMATDVPGLYAAGEAVAGANGANRLSGNAITEALVFGERAGRAAAAAAASRPRRPAPEDPAHAARALLRRVAGTPRDPAAPTPAGLVARLQDVMADRVGPFRTEAGLAEALGEIDAVEAALPAAAGWVGGGPHDPALLDWLELRGMVLTARAVALSARARTESRGAHQRLDHERTDPAWTLNQLVSLDADGRPALRTAPVVRRAATAAAD